MTTFQSSAVGSYQLCHAELLHALPGTLCTGAVLPSKQGKGGARMQMCLPLQIGRKFDPKRESWIGTKESQWVGTLAPTPSYIEFIGSQVGFLSNRNRFMHIVGSYVSARDDSPSALLCESQQAGNANHPSKHAFSVAAEDF